MRLFRHKNINTEVALVLVFSISHLMEDGQFAESMIRQNSD